MENKNSPLFNKNDDTYSSSSEYMNSSESNSFDKPYLENKNKELPKFSDNYSLNENEFISEDQFNKMQDDILKTGQKLEPLIQAYVQNHKKSSSFLPIHNLFDLFKRELKMNLIIRQNLMKEKAAKQEILNSYNQLESQKKDFLQKLSQKTNKKLSDLNEATILIVQQLDSIHDHNAENHSKELTHLKEKNERLEQQNKQMQNSLNDQETEKSMEIAQLLSTLQNTKQQITKYEIQIKEKNFQIEQLESKIEKKKQRNSLLKNNISKLKSSQETQIKELSEKALNFERLLNESNFERDNLKKEKEEQDEKIEKNEKELDILKITVKKMELIENDNSALKNKITEMKDKLKENQESLKNLQNIEVLYEKAQKIIIKMRKRNKNFRKVIKDLSNQVNQKEEEKQKASQTVSKLNSKINKLQEIHQIEIELIKTQHLEQSKQTNDKLLILEDKFHLIQKKFTFCADENKRLQYQLNQASRDINRLESENAKLFAKLEKISILNDNHETNKEFEEEEEDV